MTLVAASGLTTLVPFLLILACPLMMVFMMRGMHGGRAGEGGMPKPQKPMTLDELKHERDELNEQIGRRAEEATEQKWATLR